MGGGGGATSGRLSVLGGGGGLSVCFCDGAAKDSGADYNCLGYETMRLVRKCKSKLVPA